MIIMEMISNRQPSLPLPSITYSQWKEQQKDWLPVYDFTRTLLPVKKVKRKSKNGLLQDNNVVHITPTKEVTTRRKLKAKTPTDTKCGRIKRPQRKLQVFFRTPLNTVLCLQLDSNTLVKTIRKRIAKDLGINAREIKFTFNNFQMCDLLSLEDNGVVNESNIDIKITHADGLLGGADDNPLEATDTGTGKLSEIELLEIASEVTDVYENLAVYLGFSKTAIYHLKEDYGKSGVQQVAFEMLVKWQQGHTSRTDCRGLIAKALGKCKRNDLEKKVLTGTLVNDQQGLSDLDVAQCQAELRWTYLNSICHLPRYPWDESDCININDIFTDLSVLVEQPRPCQPLKIPLENQDQIFTYKSAAGDNSSRVIIQGEAGTGKSTLTVKFAFDWANGKEDSPVRKFKLLFLLRMRDLEYSSNLEEAIVKHLLPQDTKVTVSQLKKYFEDHPEECCVILDGYDEFRYMGSAGASSGSVVKILNNSILRDCFVIMSSRPAKLLDLGRHRKEYRHFEVSGFSKGKIREYILKFFGQNKVIAKSLVDYIESNNLETGVAAAPLVTQLLCLYWINNIDKESVGSMSTDSLVTVSKLYSALFDFLKEHFQAKSTDVTDLDMKELVLDLGGLALNSLWPPNNQLVFTRTELQKEVSEEKVKRACEVGLFQKHEATQSKSSKGGLKKSSVLSWKKISTVEFFHKSAQEKCAGEYLAYLGETNEEEFRLKMETLKSADDALNVKMILFFACGSSLKAAEMALIHLISLFQSELQQDMNEYVLGELHHERSKTIQDFIDLCLICNFECEAGGQLERKLLPLFPDQKIMFSGITPQRANALHYFLANLKSPDVIKTIALIGVPIKGNFFMPTEVMDSISDKTFHDYLRMYSKLPVMEQQQMLKEFASKNDSVCKEAERSGIPCALASMHMWQIFEDWQTETDTLLVTLIGSLKYITIETLKIRSVHLGKATTCLWKIISKRHLLDLTILNLRQTGLRAEDVEQLASCIHCLPNLKDLDIGQNMAGNAVGKLSNSLSAIHLRSLDLYRMMAPTEVMRVVHKNLPKFGTRLEELNLHINYMDDEGAEILAQNICKLELLTCLTLPSLKRLTSISSIQKVFKDLHLLPHLRLVDINSGYLNVQHFLTILNPELEKWQEIQIIRLYSFRNTDNSVDETQSEQFLKAVSSMKKLHSLKLNRIGLTLLSFQGLVELGRQKQFQTLWYNRCFLPKNYEVPDDEFIRII